ncbi:hypothetical protein O6H91_06G053200 [Diphasiastrum complanatum]|uniref:Uncharacterized protein n=1 Tax=Diphasiastrum complanatum TaxID=34168 RepID=A0ACC2DE21_DIPCM|nr:hypothetical protein O6H91_06G053200 [Diphasiastrum complanatum]
MTLSLREPTFDELNGLLLQEELRRQNLMSREDFKELGCFTKNQGKKGKKKGGKKDQYQESKDNSEKGDNLKSNPKRNGNCNFCGKYGHFAFECRKKKAIQDKKKQSGNFTEDEDKSEAVGCYELFSTSTSKNSNDCWYIDSGATQHMTPHRELFTQFDDTSVNVHVKLGDNSSYDIKGRGIVRVHLPSRNRGKIKNVLYVPGLKKNLLSVSAITKQNMKVEFDDQKCLIKDKNKGYKVVVKGSLEG